MSNLRILAALSLGAFCTLLPAQDRPANANPTSPAEAASKRTAGNPVTVANLTIGVFDMGKAFEQYPRWVKLKAQLVELQASCSDEMKKMERRLDELKGTIAVLSAESEERKRAEFDYEMGLQQKRWLAKSLQERLDLEEARAMVTVFQDVEEYIARVA